MKKTPLEEYTKDTCLFHGISFIIGGVAGLIFLIVAVILKHA